MERWLEIQNYIVERMFFILGAVSTYMAEHPEEVLVISLGLLAVGAIWGLASVISAYRRKNKGKRKVAERKKYLEGLYGDGIHEMLFKFYHEGHISRHEYRRDLRKLGRKLGIRDLLPVSFHPEAIKRRVTTACADMKASLSKVRPGTHPGPKPGEVAPLPPVKKTNRWLATKGKTLPRRVA